MAAPAALKRVALLPWGDVFEDYLDAIGRSFEEFRTEMTGGWLFGYVEALRTAGVESVIVVVTRTVDRSRRFVHEPTGAVLWALPPSRAALAARRRTGPRARELAPYLATPLVPLARLVRAERIDALVVQEYEYPRFDAAVALGRLLRRPVFATFQGGTVTEGRLAARIRPRTVRAAAGLVVGPATEASRVEDRYGVGGDGVAAIPNPIDTASWPLLPVEDARTELGIPPDALVVAWHGRVVLSHKGLDVLADAWAQVSTALPDADLRLRLLGTGPDAPALRARLDELGVQGVHWENEFTLDRERVQRHLAAADVYVFPSRHEGFPVAPLEAMAAGRAVVAARAPGVPEIFTGGEAAGGVLVPTGDARALADALVRLLSDPTLAADLGRRARARVEAAFSYGAVGAELARFLRRQPRLR